MAIGLVTEHALQKWAKDAGLILDGEHARKLTILMEVGEPTRVVVEGYGDAKLLKDPAPSLHHAKVTKVGVT